MKYRKKPVVIEANQWLPCIGSKTEMPIPPVPSYCLRERNGRLWGHDETWQIKTLEGWLNLSPFDWIIRGVKGEYYPCKPDIFEATYEKVEP